jgi:hypothetical protein
MAIHSQHNNFRNNIRSRAMRIGNSPISTEVDSTLRTENNTVSKQQAQVVENFSQPVQASTGKSSAAAMRQAEAGIGAGLRASQLRTDSLSLGDIFKNVLDWVLGKKKPNPQPGSTTNLQVSGDATFRQRVAQDLAKFAPGTTVDSQGYVHEATSKVSGHDQGYMLVNQLLNNPNKVTIQYVSNNAYTQSGTGAQGTPSKPGRGSTATVAYDPNLNISLPTVQRDGTIKDEGISSEIVLAHELVHATHAQRGTIDRSLVDHFFTDGTKQYKENWRFEEFRTTGFPGQRQGNEPTENSIRAELGFRARATYLDRSSWTAVSGLTANRTAPSMDNLVSDPWVPAAARL